MNYLECQNKFGQICLNIVIIFIYESTREFIDAIYIQKESRYENLETNNNWKGE